MSGGFFSLLPIPSPSLEQAIPVNIYTFLLTTASATQFCLHFFPQELEKLLHSDMKSSALAWALLTGWWVLALAGTGPRFLWSFSTENLLYISWSRCRLWILDLNVLTAVLLYFSLTHLSHIVHGLPGLPRPHVRQSRKGIHHRRFLKSFEFLFLGEISFCA